MTPHLEIFPSEQRVFWDKFTDNVPKRFVLYGGTAVGVGTAGIIKAHGRVVFLAESTRSWVETYLPEGDADSRLGSLDVQLCTGWEVRLALKCAGVLGSLDHCVPP